MSSKRATTPQDKRDAQLGVMLTQDEKATVEDLASDLGLSQSQCGRYLIKLGMEAHSKTHIRSEV